MYRLLIVSLFCSVLLVGEAAADMTLVDKNTAPCSVFIPDGCSKIERLAGRELAGYLSKISGRKFELKAVAKPPTGRAILVGNFDRSYAKGLGFDGYALRTEKDRLIICGVHSMGTIYGVYGFLEDILDCRWWSHNEEFVPKKETIHVPELDVRCDPPFTMHHLYNREAQNRRNNFRYKSRSTGAEYFTSGHSLYPLLKDYAEEHPEIYPMNKKGERKANNLHFCYLAPGIVEALADALTKHVERRKGEVTHAIYFAGMGDWYGGMCQCEKCKKVYKEETWTDPDGRKKPGYTATLLRMMNRTGEILEGKYPGIRVGTFAYMSLGAPPAKTRPAENVTIRVPRLRHCSVHPARTCPRNRSYLRNLERWCEITPAGVYVWEYGANFKNFIFPWPCIHSIADNIRLYNQMGIRGVMVQGNYVTTGSDLVVLKNYVWRRLMWNPELKTDELIREFCDGYYGPAGDEMYDYVQSLEDSVREPKMVHANEFAKPGYLSEEARQKLSNLRTEAIKASGGKSPYERRVREGTVGIEALLLFNPGPLQEKDGKLVGENIGEHTYPRARDVVSHVRNSGFNEWTNGKSNWTGFLLSHGGPLHKLASGETKVKIAPLLQGQVRQIIYRGKSLLVPGSDPEKRWHPASGGSIADIGNVLWSTAEKAGPRTLTLHDAFHIPGWRFSSKATVQKRIELGQKGQIIRVLIQKIRGKPAAVSISTTYRLAGKKPSNIWFKRAETDWRSLSLKGGQAQAGVDQVQALKIELPQQNCAVVDTYLSPPGKVARIVHDREKGTLTTVVATDPIGKWTGEKQSLTDMEMLMQLEEPARSPTSKNKPPLLRKLEIIPLSSE
ncbi:MAG: DUF4838 domain-containing protein [Planctomycetes bacterium]|nr:DUF4838 domain-containing protein [Planctomycetota bacterium]